MTRLLLLLGLLVPFGANAQRQLVVIKHDKVVAVFMEGSILDLVLKNGERRHEKIVELEEFQMITTGDTIPLTRIKKVKIRERKWDDFTVGFGGLFFIGGLVYLSVEALNSGFGYSSPGVDGDVVATSAILMAAGTALILAHPRYVKMGRGAVLRSVDYKSPFYQQ